MSKGKMGKKKTKSKGLPSDGTSGEMPEGSPFGESGEAIQQTIAEDPLLTFFQAHWREIVITLVVVVGFIYGREIFQKTRFESLRTSADLLLDLQSQVEELKLLNESIQSPSDKEDSAKEDEEKQEVSGPTEEQAKEFKRGQERAEELVRALAQERRPYSELSPLYERVLTSLALEHGDDSAKNVSEMLTKDGGSDSPAESSLLGELEEFHEAILLAQTESTLPKAVDKLKSIIEKGSFTGGAALALLVELSESGEVDSDMKQLKTLSSAYLERNPEQAAILKQELPQLF